MTKKYAASVPYEDYLLESLKNPREAALYLEAAMEDDDPRVFLLALRQVAQARGMSVVAGRAKVGRESLYKALSKAGNPEINTVSRVLRAAGLRLSVKPVAKAA